MNGRLLTEFLDIYAEYKKNGNYVCERLFKPHPLMENRGLTFSGVDGVYVKDVCYIDGVLSPDFANLINGKNRNILRKSHRLGNRCIVDLKIDKFIENYNEAMLAKSTTENYFIDPSRSRKILGDSSVLLSIVDREERVLASGLFFFLVKR